MGLKQRFLEYYEKNEVKVDIGFFLGGFVFDIFTLSDIDDPLSVAQQVIYLIVVGVILFRSFLVEAGAVPPPVRFRGAWEYQRLAVHFLMGSLLSIYSLFFLKSSSFFTSIVFVLVMMGLMVANELKGIQRGSVNIKIALYVICLLSFFSMLIPVILGFVGYVPSILAMAMTALTCWGIYKWMEKLVEDQKHLKKHLAVPVVAVLGMFVVFSFIGWIPPVPMSVQEMGVYHHIEKKDGEYHLYHQNPWYKFWNKGDQDFKARPGDTIYFFAKIFCPGRFDDTVTLHWQRYDINEGWQTTDRIPMRVLGGREGGYRGHALKQNYSEGELRILVETTDGRELGRAYVAVTSDAPGEERVYYKEIR